MTINFFLNLFSSVPSLELTVYVDRQVFLYCVIFVVFVFVFLITIYLK